MCYSKFNLNMNQGKPTPIGGYNNTESQYGVCTKSGQSTNLYHHATGITPSHAEINLNMVYATIEIPGLPG